MLTIYFLSLNLFLWENRLISDNGSICKVSVDGTDFKIYEPKPFSKKWFSHKFKGAGLCYEVAVAIQTGHIVWTNGPFPAGVPDINIFRQDLKKELMNGEQVEADKGIEVSPPRLTYLSRIQEALKAKF